MRKVPYIGTAIAAAQLVDAVVDRVESETADQTANRDKVEDKKMEHQE